MTQKEELFKKMLLIREAENAIIREYPKNEIKTPSHLAIGAEAIAVSVCHAFPKAKIFATYRNHHWYLACGGSLENFFLELYGKQNPIADGKAGSMHLSCPDDGLVMTSAVVASQIAPAVGYAFAQKYQGSDTLTICALGDGATEEDPDVDELYAIAAEKNWKGHQVLKVIKDRYMKNHSSELTEFEIKDLARFLSANIPTA